MTKILISSNPENLQDALAFFTDTATVEAEYGDTVVYGSIITLAHHGANASNPAPCLHVNCETGLDAIGISHCDLDTLGGVLALMGRKLETEAAKKFWALAAYVDVHGPHNIAFAQADEKIVENLHAFWAWSKENRFYAPRDGSVVSAEDWVKAAEAVLNDLFLDSDEGIVQEQILFARGNLLEKGRNLVALEAGLNVSSFVNRLGKVIARRSDDFVNHLYNTPDGKVCDAVVAYNTKSKTITVSFADADNLGLSAKEIVQDLWGNEAGGHPGIAGSPRDHEMTENDFNDAIDRVDDEVGSLYDAAGETLESYYGDRD